VLPCWELWQGRGRRLLPSAKGRGKAAGKSWPRPRLLRSKGNSGKAAGPLLLAAALRPPPLLLRCMSICALALAAARPGGPS
jgi:hypothetical protein